MMPVLNIDALHACMRACVQINIAVPWCDPGDLPEGAIDRLQHQIHLR